MHIADGKVPSYLPDLEIPMRIPRGMQNGRNLFEGYQRGWGLTQWQDKSKWPGEGLLRWHVGADPDFYETMGKVRGRCIIDEDRAKNLFLIFKYFLPNIPTGDIIEFGSYRGGGAMLMGMWSERFLSGVHVYGLDSFEGMPETNSNDLHSKGDFGDTSYDEVCAAKDSLGIRNVTFVKGFFDQTASRLLRDKRVALAHIDADIYEGCKTAVDEVLPRMVSGGYLVFDDATVASCLGATEVVADVIRDYELIPEQWSPGVVFRTP